VRDDFSEAIGCEAEHAACPRIAGHHRERGTNVVQSDSLRNTGWTTVGRRTGALCENDGDGLETNAEWP
jgi:hypothetical protein